MNPGAWLEMQDMVFPVACDDDTYPKDCDLHKWSDLMIKAGKLDATR